VKWTPRVRAGALLALAATACSEERAKGPVSPVYDVDVAPIFQARCVACHGDTNPAGGWSATSFLGAIACVAPSGAPATLPPDDRAPVLTALDTDPHRGLLGSDERSTITSWVIGGTPAFHGAVHDPGIIDPRSAGFHGTLLRASRWSAMLDPTDPGACGACHDGTLARPAGVTSALPDAPSCTSCHSQPGGVLACSTCHGSGTRAYPPRDPCFFPGDPGGAHAAHLEPSATALAAPCATCHVVPADVVDPAHLFGPVAVVFSGLAIAREALPTWDGTRCANVACHGANLPDPAAVPVWTDTSGVQAECGACHGIPPSEHTTSASCNRSDCHGSEVTLDATGAPHISVTGRALHVDGVIESAR
jgi:predicted CxxxxCH...CXXCH cytochrome family protein